METLLIRGDYNAQEDAFGISVGGPSGGESRKTELVRLTKALTERPRAGMSQPAGLCACDRRIESFLDEYFAELKLDAPLRLPAPTLVLTKHGVAREMSLPEDADSYDNAYVRSYRVRNGVLHNPRSDRRTTAGTFHIAEGGLPIPGDKKAVADGLPPSCCATPSSPPADLLVVPFTSGSAPADAQLRLASAAADRLPRGPRRVPAEDDGDPFLRPGQPGQQSRFRRVDLRQRRRPLPARERRGA